MADRPLNKQHEWGGHAYRTAPTFETGGQTFLASRPAADTDLSQVHFTASNSDDLFAPITGGPSTFPPYVLPHIPDRFSSHHRDIHTPTNFRRNNPPLQHISYPLPPYDNRTPVPHLPQRSPLQPISSCIHSPTVHPLPPVHQPSPVARQLPYPPPHLPFPNRPLQPHFQYPPPPIQYVYVPTPSLDTSLTPSSKSLPVITSIHTLNLKTDFYAWDEGVLRLLGIHGHIVDPQLPVDPLCLDISPVLKPPVSHPPTPAELKALTRWQDNDNIAQYVLVGRLGTLARQLLHPSYMSSRTAFAVYTTITRYFGLWNFGDCDELATSLLNSRCEHNRVQDYVARWRAGVARLCSVK